MDRVSDEWLDEQISYYDGLGNEVSGLGMARCAALVELRDRRAAEREQAAQAVPAKPTWEEEVKQAASSSNPHGETYGEACDRFTKEVCEMRRKVAEAFGVCERAAPTEPQPDSVWEADDWLRLLELEAGGEARLIEDIVDNKHLWSVSWKAPGGKWMASRVMDTQLAAAQVAYHSVMCAKAGGEPWLAETTHPALRGGAASQPKWERRLKRMGAELRYEPDLNGHGLWVCTFPGTVADKEGSLGLTPKDAVAGAWRAWKEERGGKA